MPKRAAANELNHYNWNQEEPEEEIEAPKLASPEVMSKRVIKTGKRRISNVAPTGTGKPAFSNFSGFGMQANQTGGDVKSPFSFLCNSNASNFNKTNGIACEKSETGNKDESSQDTNNLLKATENKYLSKLKGLNETFLEWIKIHVGKNPTCILTPIFDDYEKYIKEIQSERQGGLKEQNEKSSESAVTTTSNTNLSESFPKHFLSSNLFSSKNEFGKDSSPKSTLLSNSNESHSNIPTLTPFRSEGNPRLNQFKSTSSPKSTLLANPNLTASIPGLAPICSESKRLSPFKSTSLIGDNKTSLFEKNTFSCGNIDTPVAASTEEENDKEEDEPPKNIFAPVTEEGAVFSQRVKLFLKKDGNFVDNGVGTLYIKPVDTECSKYQAIVRADTSLGNILLNIVLKESFPSKRVGKNNVMIVCVMEVDKDKSLKSVPALLRVKTEADADNLLEQINKYKK